MDLNFWLTTMLLKLQSFYTLSAMPYLKAAGRPVVPSPAQVDAPVAPSPTLDEGASPVVVVTGSCSARWPVHSSSPSATSVNGASHDMTSPKTFQGFENFLPASHVHGAINGRNGSNACTVISASFACFVLCSSKAGDVNLHDCVLRDAMKEGNAMCGSVYMRDFIPG